MHILCDWILENQLSEMSHLAYSILFPQLIATLLYYSCTFAIPGLADWAAFLEWVLSTM